jgi:hypothetical protein
MNSYSLGIAGDWWLFAIFILISAAASWWAYRITNPPVGPSKKLFLGFLRFAGILFLLFSLFEPVMSIITGRQIPPSIVLLLDNSRSAAAEDASGDRKESYLRALNDSEILKEENVNVRIFGSDYYAPENFSPDSLDFSDEYTDISSAIRNSTNIPTGENVKAAILISDGTFNRGNNPLYDARIFGKPVYTVGIGDSLPPRDLIVKSVITNEIAYVDNTIPVNVEFESNGFSNDTIMLTLREGEQVLDSAFIELDEDINSYSAFFTFTPTEEGETKISVSSEKRDGEISFRNNSANAYVTVLKNKRMISIFSGAPNSDIAFLSTELNKSKGIEINKFIQKSGPAFFREPTDEDLFETEVFVFIDFPVNSTPGTLLGKIKKELDKGKPILFMSGLNTDYSKIRFMENNLPFEIASSNRREFFAEPDIKPEYLTNPLLRLTGSDEDLEKWNKLPPVFRTETFVRPKPESEIVAEFKVNNVPLNEPLILIREFAGQKSVAFLGYGFYRWKLTGYASDAAKGLINEPDLYSTLVNNTFRWLSVKETEKLVNIKTIEKEYPEGETVEFFAQVYDRTYKPLDGAEVKVTVTGEGESREITLVSRGNGRYTGNLNGLAKGEYRYNGNAIHKGNEIGKDAGIFSVGDISAEFADLTMNAPLMRSIAGQTGGNFYTPDDVGKLMDDICANPGFKEKSVTSRSELAVWNTPWLLALAILLFSIEWFVRKRSGML